MLFAGGAIGGKGDGGAEEEWNFRAKRSNARKTRLPTADFGPWHGVAAWAMVNFQNFGAYHAVPLRQDFFGRAFFISWSVVSSG